MSRALPVCALKIDFDTNKRHFVLIFPRRTENFSKIRMDVQDLPGARFIPEDDSWVVPVGDRISAIALRLLAQKHGFLGSPAAREQLVKLEGERGRALLRASRAVEGKFDVPGLARTLRPYQQAGVYYASIADWRTFIADLPGVGKTAQAIGILEQRKAYPALVVCPASAKYNWLKELGGWLPHRRATVIDSGQTFDPSADIVIVNYDLLADGWTEVASIHPPVEKTDTEARSFLALLGIQCGGYDKTAHRIKNCHIPPASRKMLRQYPGWRVEVTGKRVIISKHIEEVIRLRGLRGLVCDESHYLTNEKSQRTSAALEIVKAHEGSLQCRILLTGTPINNKVREYIPQLKILGRLNDLGGWAHIIKRYCGAVQTNYGWHHPNASPAELHSQEFNELLRSTCFIRRKKTEVLKDLPPKSRVQLLVNIDMKGYAREEKALVAWLEQGNMQAMGSSPSKAAEALMRLGKLRKATSQGKLTLAYEWIQEFIESGEKLIVFAYFKETQDLIYEKFKDVAVRVHSDDKPIDRQRQVDIFQTNPAIRIIVISLIVGREALNITAASDVFFVEMGWTSTAHDQAEDRAWRSGQLSSVTCTYLVARNTVDEYQWEIIDRKRSVVGASADGEVMVSEDESKIAIAISQHLFSRHH